jgi:hypothetical protein
MEKDLLRRIFKYPVSCSKCLDGPGHLLSHLLGRNLREVTQKITLFGKIQLEGRYMLVTCIIMSTLDEDETFSLAGFSPEVDEYIVRTLEEEIHEVMSSQFLLLVMIWNTLADGKWWSLGDLGGIVVGLRKALRLPYDPKATLVLGPLSLNLLHRGNDFLVKEYGTFAERELIKREITITSHLLLTNLAVRSIFGRLNSQQISCAQAVGDVPPALGWLPPYD